MGRVRAIPSPVSYSCDAVRDGVMDRLQPLHAQVMRLEREICAVIVERGDQSETGESSEVALT